jgi:hypothetical protein
MKAVHFILKQLNYCKIIRAPKPHPQEEEEQDEVLKRTRPSKPSRT